MANNKAGDVTTLHGIGFTGSNSISDILGSVLPQISSSVETSTTKLSQRLENLTSVAQLQSEIISANTQAVIQDTSARQSPSTIAQLGNAASNLLQGGLGFSPIISGLMDLFGAHKPSASQPLVQFSLPPSLTFQAANTESINGLQPGADYGQSGMPRSMQATSRSVAPSVSGPQITINVQAMDSRSFLDHSSEIAQAVKDAMLNMHSLNDVVGEL